MASAGLPDLDFFIKTHLSAKQTKNAYLKGSEPHSEIRKLAEIHETLLAFAVDFNALHVHANETGTLPKNGLQKQLQMVLVLKHAENIHGPTRQIPDEPVDAQLVGLRSDKKPVAHALHVTRHQEVGLHDYTFAAGLNKFHRRQNVMAVHDLVGIIRQPAFWFEQPRRVDLLLSHAHFWQKMGLEKPNVDRLVTWQFRDERHRLELSYVEDVDGKPHVKVTMASRTNVPTKHFQVAPGVKPDREFDAGASHELLFGPKHQMIQGTTLRGQFQKEEESDVYTHMVTENPITRAETETVKNVLRRLKEELEKNPRRLPNYASNWRQALRTLGLKLEETEDEKHVQQARQHVLALLDSA